MLYLANASTPEIRAAMALRQSLGQMCTPKEGRLPVPVVENGEVVDHAWFAGDNGCYGGKFPGGDQWYRWLTGLVGGRERRCLFAVAPDEFNPYLRDDMGAVSMDRSRPFLADIRVLGVPVAVVAQNGLTEDMVPWEDIDVLFLGGCRRCLACGWWPTFTTLLKPPRCPECGGKTSEWKVGPDAYRLARAATDRGKRVHMGRGNSLRRKRIAEMFGCTTMDGTLLARGPDRWLPFVLSWWDETHLFETDHMEGTA